MKLKPLSFAGAMLFALFFNHIQAQTIGIKASAVWVSDCNQSAFYNTSGNFDDLIGSFLDVFPINDFGVHTQNSGTLILRGAQLKTFKTPLTSNVCTANMHYRVYKLSSSPGPFTSIDLPFLEDCDVPNSSFPSGGACIAGDQKWNRVIDDGTVTPYSPVNLTNNTPGDYVLEVYYDITGSSTSTTLCDETVTLNNNGNNYKAYFSIQSPTVNSTNPSSCFGSQGSITIGGLVQGAVYTFTYTDDGTTIGPANYTASNAGQITVTGLNAGFYAGFTLLINGCTTNLFTGIMLSDPIFVPSFNSFVAFCQGTTPPVLPTTSKNGLIGTWNPTTVDNQNSGTYTFTPNTGQCSVPITINVTVTPRKAPSFSFGTSLSVCAGGTVPTLPNNSTNGVSGTWSPATIDNQNSGTYTFTPNMGQCANAATLTVTVNPNITPAFAIGANAEFCAGATAPVLPATSTNGITGTWNPATVDNQNSGTYTFTPATGLCATTTTFTVTVNPNVTPVFSFGTSQNICAGGNVPALPGTSDNGIAGTWSPATIDKQNSGTYTFTPAAGLCAVAITFTVTVNPNITPAFSFGTTLTICAGGTVPALLNTSTNGITGIWSPATVDNQNSGAYTFTPGAGQCAVAATFTVTVNPNITPAFTFGTSLTLCAGSTAPALPTTSTNGITGIWNPAAVDNQNSGTYTFTPTAGLCATITTFTVTVNPNVTPVFSFGTSQNICAGGSVPTLPGTSDNGIAGTWSPATVDQQNSGTYTFTPAAGLCAVTTSFTVTVNPNITPAFSFGTTLTICEGGTVPTLPNTSTNGITGTWNPAVVDNQNSGTYTFTPAAGLCANTTTFTVTVNPNITPTFSFGSFSSICAGATVPVLPTTSTDGITGTWSPAVVDNQNSGTYTFTPGTGQCAVSTTFSLIVNPVFIPAFSFGPALTICAGDNVPTLPNTSDNAINGSWTPNIVSNQASGTYIFSAPAGQCVIPYTYTVTVNPILTPTFSFGTFQSVCIGSSVPALPTTSTNGITGTWNPASIDNMVNGTYTFTPDPGQCTTTATFTLEVNPIPTVSAHADTSVYDGAVLPVYTFTNTAGSIINWTNSNTAIGLPASGTGSIPSFTATNLTDQPITATITVTPAINGCSGASQTYKITVLPLNKDIFVPNVFSPNGDGKNDWLYVYGNYITKVDMHVYNQWGQEVATITNKTQGWDGKHKSTAQPAGVYMYVLKAELADGRKINQKGSVTLVR